MIVTYFEDTDTLYLQFNQNEVAETRDLDKRTVVEYDHKGHMVAITLEHAKESTEVSDFSFQNILSKSA
ncbi:MAG: DUF2283 domain-containing protein [Candidatus Omnitrophica bacterium]|nr:DUF2283 domain-containing protein [Candidatus Omnitrophota bacterium]